MDAKAEPEPQAPRAVGVPLATAFIALLAGNAMAVLTDGRPATNARTAWLLWGSGLVASAVVLSRGVRRRPFVLAATLLIAVLLGAMTALSVASYPASVRSEENMLRARQPGVEPVTAPAP